MSAEDVVRDAIARRQSVFLVYRDGETRVVQPHVLYVTHKASVCLDAYQVAGASASGMLPGWREFDLAQTTDVEPVGDAFTVAPGFDPGAPKYRHGVLAAVAQSTST
jgi:hypothetical protein